ncbi:MAG TPA: IS4 family transposase [Thermoanaerobaculia bacterium]|nr:IS4 family transposase [Thermoanaerobaculia bacterium]
MGESARRFEIAKSGIGVLAEAFPLETVQAILAATGREGKRKRLLPASMMVYYVIALGLFVGVGCREVLRRLLDGAMWIWPNEVRVATESAITQARQRLGSIPIEKLYEEVVVPIAKKVTRGAWFRGWRVVTIDGFILDVAESEENVKAFGRPGSSRGKSAYPQVRVVGFLENGTHVFFGAEMDRCDVGETTIARRILGKLRKNMLCLADRNFLCYPLWQTSSCDRSQARLASEVAVGDSEDSEAFRRIVSGQDLSLAQASAHRSRGIEVRLVDYRIDGFRENYRLVTNILDPKQAPALELARLYSERWTIETAFDELKTHLRGSNVVLRSKLPKLVRQDVFGLLLAHFGVRFVMHDAALSEDIAADELSFAHTLRVVHRKLPWFVSFSPSAAKVRV